MSWTLTRMRLPLRCTDPSKDVANAELLADPLQVDMFSLVSESGIATNHETADHARQIRRQALSDTIDKMLLLRVAAWRRAASLWKDLAPGVRLASPTRPGLAHPRQRHMPEQVGR